MEVKKELELIKLPLDYKLVIPVDVEKKIRHLCQKIPNVEWSGTLFYTYEGSIEDNNLVITCKDIFVMDIGSATYTEFDMSPDVISYMCDNSELLGVQMGLIHSHNTMSTFFSGTDLATLKEEGRDRNHFVSLIVNNAGTYTAAITRKVKSTKLIQETYSYNSFEDTTVSGTKEYQDETEIIEYFNLDITKEGESVSFQELDDRINEIRKKKASTQVKPNEANPIWIKRPSFSLFDVPIDKSGTKYKTSPLKTTNISKEDIEYVLLQMITGSIVIKDTSKIDIRKWASTMPQVFGTRFGVSERGFNNFEEWAEKHCEFLIYDMEPEGLTVTEENEWLAQFAIALYEELDNLPKNRYIEILKEIIEQWIIQE